MALQEAEKSENQHAGVKRKNASLECPIEQPPQKRHKSNTYYNRQNAYDDDDDDESMHSASPPFILFSPQQQSTDDDSEEEHHKQYQQNDVKEQQSVTPITSSNFKKHYNPDIIQGFEHLIPSKRYNPFYDSYTMHSNNKYEQDTQSIPCAPSLPTELTTEQNMDSLSQCNGNSQNDSQKLHNYNDHHEENRIINEDHKSDDDDDDGDNDKQEKDNRGKVEGGGPPITNKNQQNNDENTKVNTNCNKKIQHCSDTMKKDEDEDNDSMNMEEVSADTAFIQNNNENNHKSISEKDIFALKISEFLNDISNTESIQINQEESVHNQENNEIQPQKEEDQTLTNGKDDTDKDNIHNLQNVVIQTESKEDNNDDMVDLKHNGNEMIVIHDMDDEDDDEDDYDYHDLSQLDDEDEEDEADDDDDDIYDVHPISLYNNKHNNNVIELLSDDTETDDAMPNTHKEQSNDTDRNEENALNNSKNDKNNHSDPNDNECNIKGGLQLESKQTEFMRYPQDSPKPVIITIGDIGRLRPQTYLNDSIIDFYLKYLYAEMLNDEQRSDTHIFSQFFYTKLDQSIDEKNEKARLKLAKWTKNINIFSKKLLIVPINIALHWSLAIIVNPGYSKALVFEEETVYEFCFSQVLSIISSSVFDEAPWIHTLSTHKHIVAIANYPRKILHFDSMRGCHPTSDIHNKLRIYLNDEWKRQNNEDKVVFNRHTIPGISLGVPQQMNSADCGVYLLHYAELFTLNPFYNCGNSISRHTWFTQSDITHKRMDIKELCVRLRKAQGKHDIDIDHILDKLRVTLESQCGVYDDDEEMDEYSDEEDDYVDVDDEIMEFEDRLWEIEEDLLKDKLALKARHHPYFRTQMIEILNEIEREAEIQNNNHHQLYNYQIL